MGGGKGGKHQTSFSRIPDSAYSADTKIDAVICSFCILNHQSIEDRIIQ